MKKAEPPKKAGTAKTTAKAPADASKKRFGMKSKTPPPAPRQARVRPRLSVTVLGDPSPDRPLFEDPILAQLSAADSAQAQPEPIAETPINLDWPAQPSTPEIVADQPSIGAGWPEIVSEAAHDDAAAAAPTADDFLDLSWPPAAAGDAPKPPAKATPRSTKAAAPKAAAAKAAPKQPAQKPASRKPAQQPPAPPVMPEPALDLNWPPAEPAATPVVPAGAPRAAKPASPAGRRTTKAPAEATPAPTALEIELDLSSTPPIPEETIHDATANARDLTVPDAPQVGADPMESEKPAFAIELDLSPTPPAIDTPPAPVDIAAEMPELPAALRLGATPLDIPMDLSPTPPVPTLWTPEPTGRSSKEKVQSDGPSEDATPTVEPTPAALAWDVSADAIADEPNASATATDLAPVETSWPEVTPAATTPEPAAAAAEPAPKITPRQETPKAKRVKPAPPAPVDAPVEAPVVEVPVVEPPVAEAPIVETPVAAPVVDTPAVEVEATPPPAAPEPVVAAEPERSVTPAPPAPAPRARRAAPRPAEAPRKAPAPAAPQVEVTPAPVAAPIATPEPAPAPAPDPTPAAATAPAPARKSQKTRTPAPAPAPARAEPTVAAAPPTPAPSPVVDAGPVAAPGWPEPGELTKPKTKAKSAGQKKKATYSASRIGNAGEMESAYGEGFRPYRPIHERNIDLMENQLEDAEHLVWIERAAALWDRSATETEDRKVNWLEVRLKEAEKELRKVEARTRDENGDLRNARKLEITEEIRRALGDDELALHFDIRVGHGRFVFSRKDADSESRPGMIRGSRSEEHEATHAH